MLALIVLLPLVIAAFYIAALKGRNATRAKYAAIAGSGAALALILTVTMGSAFVPWFSVGGYVIGIAVSVTPLSYLLLFIVLAIGLLVFIYSAGYMEKLSEQRKYYIEMLVFEASMAAFSVSGNFILMFMAWEMMSLTSYLLIGFWHEREQANTAARKAITIVFIGDVAFLAAIALFWSMFGTLQFSQILTLAASAAGPRLYAAVLLMLVAVFTKSAQFPFQEWLIDAMEGPTPVSAYLHSSTMVKAGVFVVILLYPLFSAHSISQIILIVAVVTAVLAALAASREMHIKKVIAYSTVQELSLILIAVSSSAVIAGIYFFVVQSFYKALLFFISGIAMKASGSEQLDKVAGLGSSRMALLSAVFGVLSLAGFIPFSGFFADSAISTALYPNLALYVVLSAISMLTSFYIFRWFSYLARNPGKSVNEAGYITQPRSMVYPAVALAVATLAASLIYFKIQGFVGPVGGMTQFGISQSDAILLTILVSVGAVLACAVYYRARKAPAKAVRLTIVHSGHAVNLLYGAASAMMLGLTEGVAIFDGFVSDGFDKIGRLAVASGYAIRRTTSGNINYYAVAFTAGMAMVAALLYYLVVI